MEKFCEKHPWSNITNAILYLLLVLTNLALSYKTIGTKLNGSGGLAGKLLILLPWLPGLVLVPNEAYVTLKANVSPVELRILILTLARGIFNLIFYPAVCFFQFLTGRNCKTFQTSFAYTNLNQIMLGGVNLVHLCFMTFRGEIVRDGQLDMTLVLVIVSATTSIGLYLNGALKHLEEDLFPEKVYPLPFLTATLIFRTTAHAYILTYLDYLSILPYSGLVLVILAHQGWSEIEEDEDDIGKNLNNRTLGPFAMIWTGENWIPRYLHSSKINSNTQEGRGELPMISKGLLRIFIPCSKNTNRLCHLYFDNILILLICAAIFMLVQFSSFFMYEQNNITNQLFIKLSILIFCYGAFSPLLVFLIPYHFAKSFLTVTFTFLSCLAVLVFPVVLYITGKPVVTMQQYLFTLSQSSDLIVSPVILANIESIDYNNDRDFGLEDIYLNTSCDENITNKHLLIFIDLKSEKCKSIKLNSTLDVFVQKHKTTTRVSSPKLNNLFTIKNLTELRTISGNNTLKIGNMSYMLSVLKMNSVCSPSVNVEIILSNNDPCKQQKFLDENSFVYEQQCIRFNNLIHRINVHCGQLNSAYKVVKGGQLLKNSNFLGLDNSQYQSCCLNDTHSLQVLGNCSPLTYTFNRSINFEPVQECDSNFNQWNIGYTKLSACIVVLKYQSPCNRPGKILPFCSSISCYQTSQVDA